RERRAPSFEPYHLTEEPNVSRLLFRSAACAGLMLALLSFGCRDKWDVSGHPVKDEELDSAFFAGLNSVEIPDVPEPQRLRPCCIFGNDVGVSVGHVPVPGYEVRNVLDIDELGTHNYNNGLVSLQRPEEGRVVSDEASGILYTCRGGFIDIAHVRDNADRTLYLIAQIGRLAASGGTIPLVSEGAERRIVVRPLDPVLIRAHGAREVIVILAEWIDFQASIWHEIATWYNWSSTSFSERPSAFSPEDLYSNLIGAKIAGAVVRRHAAASEHAYNLSVTAFLKDALVKLGPLPKDASRRAFAYVDGIWWDSTRRVPDNRLVRHRNFDIGPKLYPWKLKDAQVSEALAAAGQEFDEACGGDWTPLGLNVPDRIGDVPFRQLATLEIRPDEVLARNGFVLPRGGSNLVTQDDFPALIRAIARAADAELGAGAGLPAARLDEAPHHGR
ncbi:MAG: DUF4056 domain-containing protein, partial [bacterium]